MTIKQSTMVAGGYVASMTALIVLKMVALEWAGHKLQERFGRR